MAGGLAVAVVCRSTTTRCGAAAVAVVGRTMTTRCGAAAVAVVGRTTTRCGAAAVAVVGRTTTTRCGAAAVAATMATTASCSRLAGNPQIHHCHRMYCTRMDYVGQNCFISKTVLASSIYNGTIWQQRTPMRSYHRPQPLDSVLHGRRWQVFHAVILSTWSNPARTCVAASHRAALATSASKGSVKPVFERNFITAVRAMQDFCLKPEHLGGLRVTSRRSPNENLPAINVYWRRDVEAKAVDVWGSLEKLEAEIERRKEQEIQREDNFSFYTKFVRQDRRKRRRRTQELSREMWPVRGLRMAAMGKNDLASSSRVVNVAIAINTANFLGKAVAWLFTGSHAMFSETIHSAADTVNQLILAYGIKRSTKQPDVAHPYGYSNMQYVSSLISGVGIFCMGAGLSIYHGVHGLVVPQAMGSLTVGFVVLSLSFVSESVTLALAVKSIRGSARDRDIGFLEFVVGGYAPSVNVVLLEDLAAVGGVGIAALSMGLSYYTGSHVPDAIGSIAIGGILGAVATFMIFTNSRALVGRSIPHESVLMMNKILEGDIMVRQIHDVKGIDMGNGVVRYKAEVDVDGRELTRYYLQQQDLVKLLAEVQAATTKEEFERFMLKHGENLVDCLGEQVDRIETELKKQHPEVRHVDLEVL